MFGKSSILALIDQGLGMLNTRPHGEWLLHHIHPGHKQHLLGISGAGIILVKSRKRKA